MYVLYCTVYSMYCMYAQYVCYMSALSTARAYCARKDWQTQSLALLIITFHEVYSVATLSSTATLIKHVLRCTIIAESHYRFK